ncbi:MAG TPA: NUDIX domain-containing protein [Micromonospora sp.]|nr:NUDIX domain-containing protein [Micromonospora sp.]
MRASVAVVHDLVSGLAAGDELEAEHRAETLRWLKTTDDVFRRVKPATPRRHLVSYVVPVDPVDGSVLLVNHLKAGLWLPPGGHVDPDEHPTQTARREAQEELGIDADSNIGERPVFLTVTRTVGVDVHTDASLWYVLSVHRRQRMVFDQTEFREARWWLTAEIRAADPAQFDPHLTRFLAKIGPLPIRLKSG